MRVSEPRPPRSKLTWRSCSATIRTSRFSNRAQHVHCDVSGAAAWRRRASECCPPLLCGICARSATATTVRSPSSKWRGVVDFAKAVNADILTSFATGVGTRNSAGVWTPDQAKRWLDFTRAAGGRIAAAEWMNEPTLAAMGGAPKGYDAAAFGRDFKIFHAFAKELKLLMWVPRGAVYFAAASSWPDVSSQMIAIPIRRAAPCRSGMARCGGSQIQETPRLTPGGRFRGGLPRTPADMLAAERRDLVHAQVQHRADELPVEAGRHHNGLRPASICRRLPSRKGGSESFSPRVASGSSVAKPGPSVAISNRMPFGSRK